MSPSSSHAKPPLHIIVTQSFLTETQKRRRNDDETTVCEQDTKRDTMDAFNHPRLRQALILDTLLKQCGENKVTLQASSPAADLKTLYQSVHSADFLEFLSSAWQRWIDMGPTGRDPAGYLHGGVGYNDQAPALIPCNFAIPRLPNQRPSKHVIGQIGYYCNDRDTPVFDNLLTELLQDAGTCQATVDCVQQRSGVYYCLNLHPGHHAAADSFGGYCYVNHVAAMARALQSETRKVAILDVDYHCGNGTASILENDDSILVISLHCHPDYEYPFHVGFNDAMDNEAADSETTTLHLPLPPRTDWPTYQAALQRAMRRIATFEAQVLLVSMGLDTHANDPVTLRGAGFTLEQSQGHYREMGQTIAQGLNADCSSVVFVQEGGYYLSAVPNAAVDVVTACLEALD